ncbi:zinc ribbon domain-containing protein [Haloarcula litorea]|uniref:zinc ribbon domain-containing protein n=1 Tax=Haloarcula litorea TaxID=3032579 RepID=UPI0023E7A26F|nr:zinc ribbon domain-containing protein [Halomicroarcula sp. GDY20]
MSDAGTERTVECPLCGESFDPTTAGGWCTNPDCGEWQYTEGGDETGADDPGSDESDDDDVSLFSQPDDEEEETGDRADDQADDADDSVTASDLFSEASEPADDAEPETAGPTDGTGDESGDADPSGQADEGTEAHDVADAVAGESGTDAAAVGGAEPADPDDGGETTAESPGEPESVTDDPGGTARDATAAASDEPTSGGSAEETEAEGREARAAATIDCPDCGEELDADANFCVQCGADVGDLEPAGPLTECPGCGVDVDEDDNFCANCGEDLDAHRGDADDGPADTGSADETAPEQSEDTDRRDEPVPQRLRLRVEGRAITVGDGDTVGREVREALADAGRPDDEALRVHREHVEFERSDEGFYLVDRGKNPTRLNGRSLQQGDREPVGPGDEVELAGVATLSVRAP